MRPCKYSIPRQTFTLIKLVFMSTDDILFFSFFNWWFSNSIIPSIFIVWHLIHYFYLYALRDYCFTEWVIICYCPYSVVKLSQRWPATLLPEGSCILLACPLQSWSTFLLFKHMIFEALSQSWNQTFLQGTLLVVNDTLKPEYKLKVYSLYLSPLSRARKHMYVHTYVHIPIFLFLNRKLNGFILYHVVIGTFLMLCISKYI